MLSVNRRAPPLPELSPTQREADEAELYAGLNRVAGVVAGAQGVIDLLRDVAQQVVVYLNPDFHRAITRYALERSAFRAKVKTHDLIVEALETWAASHGINLPVRAKEPPQPKRKVRSKT